MHFISFLIAAPWFLIVNIIICFLIIGIIFVSKSKKIKSKWRVLIGVSLMTLVIILAYYEYAAYNIYLFLKQPPLKVDKEQK